jgi:hypothetical protein
MKANYKKSFLGGILVLVLGNSCCTGKQEHWSISLISSVIFQLIILASTFDFAVYSGRK